MNPRRRFLRSTGLAALTVPAAGARAILEIGKPPPPLLQPVQPGQLLTAEWLNTLVDAINEIRTEQHV